MNKYVLFSVIGLAVILSAGTALAYQGEFTKLRPNAEDWQERHEQMNEQKTAMDEIFANKDYSAWQTMMEERVNNMRVNADDFSANISEENFSKMAEAHALMQVGDFAGAMAIHEELGVGGVEREFGNQRVKGFGMHEKNCPFVE